MDRKLKIFTLIILGLAMSITTYASVDKGFERNREEIKNTREQALELAKERRERLKNEAEQIREKNKERLERLSESTERRKEEAKELRERASSTRAENKVEMVKNKKDIILRDYKRGIEVLENLFNRIESRIEKIGGRANDNTEATLLLDISRERISLVKAEYAELEAMIPEEVEKAKASDLFKQIRDQSIVVRKAMKDVHGSLVEIIASLKNSTNTSATSTNQ